ncbi:hypothetical protein [Bacillus thuringiensis]|nr:hypothetical protein [Bacillus thuringiensis]
MRVQEVKLDGNKKRYLLLEEQGKPVTGLVTGEVGSGVCVVMEQKRQ